MPRRFGVSQNKGGALIAGWNLTSVFVFQGSGSGFRVPGFRLSIFKSRVSGVWVPGSWCQISGCSFRLSGCNLNADLPGLHRLPLIFENNRRHVRIELRLLVRLRLPLLHLQPQRSGLQVSGFEFPEQTQSGLRRLFHVFSRSLFRIARYKRRLKTTLRPDFRSGVPSKPFHSMLGAVGCAQRL